MSLLCRLGLHRWRWLPIDDDGFGLLCCARCRADYVDDGEGSEP